MKIKKWLTNKSFKKVLVHSHTVQCSLHSYDYLIFFVTYNVLIVSIKCNSSVCTFGLSLWSTCDAVTSVNSHPLQTRRRASSDRPHRQPPTEDTWVFPSAQRQKRRHFQFIWLYMRYYTMLHRKIYPQKKIKIEQKWKNIKSFTMLLSLYGIISQNADHLLTRTTDNITTLEQHYVEIGILCNLVPPTLYILT